MILELIRLEEGPHGTFGVLKINKQVFCFTLELQDRLNKPNESCIPAQQYVCKPFTRANGETTWEVTDVPGRYSILFHPGNTVDDTAGCILLGQFISNLKAEPRAVLNSGKTFEKFMDMTSHAKQLHLSIVTHYG